MATSRNLWHQFFPVHVRHFHAIATTNIHLFALAVDFFCNQRKRFQLDAISIHYVSTCAQSGRKVLSNRSIRHFSTLKALAFTLKRPALNRNDGYIFATPVQATRTCCKTFRLCNFFRSIAVVVNILRISLESVNTFVTTSNLPSRLAYRNITYTLTCEMHSLRHMDLSIINPVLILILIICIFNCTYHFLLCVHGGKWLSRHNSHGTSSNVFCLLFDLHVSFSMIFILT
jgi:hypothetical protein